MKMFRHLTILITLITCLMGFGNIAQAHVYWKPNTGNDSNDGSTADKPVKTWGRAKTLLTISGFTSVKNLQYLQTPRWMAP